MPLTRDQVVAEAMRLTDGDGLDALSLRTLAARLGVQAPTLYWHVGSKAELLEALADVIMDEAMPATLEPGAGSGVREWLLEALVGLRASMLRHRDGARIVSGARLSWRRADFSELAISTLAEHGLDLQLARLLTVTAEHYTIGFVLEEQAPEPNSAEVDLDELRRRFPYVTRAIAEYFEAGRTADDLYRDGVRLILASGGH